MLNVHVEILAACRNQTVLTKCTKLNLALTNLDRTCDDGMIPATGCPWSQLTAGSEAAISSSATTNRGL